MKKALIILMVFFLNSCASKQDNPLIIPPNFNEMPDLNNIEKPNPQQQNEDVEKLKALLIKSEE